ncbi:MAG: ATP-binding cassette domain-containing protein [Lachnospiraceae bacterium]|nr:ATP-binding cassette domain-containing protein [Lachnospiraceae bacterium]
MRLEVKDLRKSFGETEVLHGLSFTVESGRALGLLGRNGAGKTTTIRILMDVFRANEGSVTLDGKPFSPKEIGIGYLPEERGLYPKKTVSEQLMYLARLRGMEKNEALSAVKYYLQRMGVEEYANRKLEILSKGNQQKVQLASTLIHNPPVVILDEPFSGLDPVNAQVLKDVIREQIAEKKLVIFSSHQMSYVEEFCNDIVILNHGKAVLSGELQQLKKEFGHNRLILSLNGCNGEQTAEKTADILKGLAYPDGIRKDQVILRLTEEGSKSRVMQALASAELDVELFGDYRPSLNDIFVESAGDES